MRLIIFNGSPRGKTGNTEVLLKHFLKGFSENKENSYELHRLINCSNYEALMPEFLETGAALIAFPLYIDSMPGHVKKFIETLEPLCGKLPDLRLLFLVQSGFPEATHSKYVRRYCKKLAVRLGVKYTGTIIRGGSEGARFMPETFKDFIKLQELGREFGEFGTLNQTILTEIAGPEKLSETILSKFPPYVDKPAFTDYWDDQLRKNGVFEKRFDKPYSE